MRLQYLPEKKKRIVDLFLLFEYSLIFHDYPNMNNQWIIMNIKEFLVKFYDFFINQDFDKIIKYLMKFQTMIINQDFDQIIKYMLKFPRSH